MKNKIMNFTLIPSVPTQPRNVLPRLEQSPLFATVLLVTHILESHSLGLILSFFLEEKISLVTLILILSPTHKKTELPEFKIQS